jgi:SAM-dependent methyltransferase
MAAAHQTSDDTKRLSELIEGYWSTQVINAALQLGVPDLLAAGPQDAQSLAATTSAHAGSLDRLLRAMETLGLCTRDADNRLSLTGTGSLLRSDAAGSMRGRGLFAANMLWHQFGDLAEVVRTGERAPSAPPDFESMDPARLAVFQQAMAESSLKAAADAVAVYDFGRFRRLLDVGGGFGGVLAFLLERYPALTGDIYDLDLVASGATAFLEKAGLSTRARFVAGNFFQSVPGGYDCYQLKYILHDWDDAHALTLLKCIRAAAASDARLVVLEQVVPDRLEDRFEHRAVIRGDLTMMTVGGKERTAAEYRTLLAEAGFRLTEIVPTASSFSVIEAVPA